MPTAFPNIPEDKEALQAMVRSLLLARDQEQQRAAAQAQQAREYQRRADELYLENLRLQVELGRLKKWYYGPRADQLQSEGDVAQLLLAFAEAMDRKPVNPADLRRHGVDPQLYLTQLLVNLPAMRTSDLRDWLPDRWKARQKTRLAALENQAATA